MSKKKIDRIVFSSKDGSLENLKNVLKKSPQDSLTHSWNILRDACCVGDLNIIKYIFRLNNIHHNLRINTQDEYGNTALLYACKNNQLEVVKYLLSNSELSEPADISRENNFKETPLLVACANGYLDIVRFLLTNKGIAKNSSLLETDKEGRNSLMYAICNENIETFNYLFDMAKNYFPNIINHQDKNGNTIFLMDMKSSTYIERITHVLSNSSKAFININLTDNSGNDIITNLILNGSGLFNRENVLKLTDICISKYDLKISRKNLNKMYDYIMKIESKYHSLLKKNDTSLYEKILFLVKNQEVKNLESNLIFKEKKAIIKV